MNQPQKAKQAYERAILIEPQKVYAKEKLEELMLENDPMAKIQKGPLSASTITLTSSTRTSGEYELQTGAFQLQENALRMQKKLERKGYKARILELKGLKNTTWYLVRTGVYPRQDAAKSFKAILKNDIGGDVIIRPFGRF